MYRVLQTRFSVYHDESVCFSILFKMKSARKFVTLLMLAAMTFAHAQPMALPQPSAGLMPNPAQGKRLFEKNCASCHGLDLKGTDKGPPFLHPVYEPSHHGDASFQVAVRNGSRAHHWKFGDMPPVANVSADDVAHITSYVRIQQRLVGIR